MKSPIPAPQGFTSWLDYAIATMDARGAFADRLFTTDGNDIPSQVEIRAEAQAELDALKAAAKVTP